MDHHHTPDHSELAAWLAAQTGADPIEIEAEFGVGARRRAFVVDELVDAGYTNAELLDFVLRLTALGPAGAKLLIAEREGLFAESRPPGEIPRRDRRLAQNEIIFREVNERLAAALGSPLAKLELVCECSDSACRSIFTMPASEYEWLRQHPRRFAVLPGHEAPAVEAVVERHNGFVVVEKHAETHPQVEASDPRA